MPPQAEPAYPRPAPRALRVPGHATKERTRLTEQHCPGPARRGQRLDALLAHERTTLPTWQHRRRERYDLRLLRLDDRLHTA